MSAVIRRRETSRTPERSKPARDRDAAMADELFQMYVRETRPYHNEMETIDKDPESWLIATRAQTRRTISIWRTITE
eukprot:3840497-Karenia_brevis.AAC.1